MSDKQKASCSQADIETKILQYLSLPVKERWQKFETLSLSERNLAKKMWFKMHQSETIKSIGGLY